MVAVISPPELIVVLPLGFVILPKRLTEAFDVIVMLPVVAPEKSIPIGLSALTDMVSVRLP